MTSEIQHVEEVYQSAELLHSLEDINTAIEQMAADITRDLQGSSPILIPVMTGGLIFAGALLPKLPFPLQLDYLHATRYRGDCQGGLIHWLSEPKTSLKGRVVLILDDILDGGVTFREIVAYCREHGAEKVLTAVLVDKVGARDETGLQSADYTGLKCDNRFVFGYGMDYKEYLRNAPGIFAVTNME